MRCSLLAVALVAEVVGAAPPGLGVELREVTLSDASNSAGPASTFGERSLVGRPIAGTLSDERGATTSREVSAGPIAEAPNEPGSRFIAGLRGVSVGPIAGSLPGAAREGRGEAGARPCSQAGVLLGLGAADLHGAQFALQAAPAGGGGSQLINQVVSANSVGLPIAGLLPDRRAAHLFEVPTLGACPGAAREGRGEAGARLCSQVGVLLELGAVDLHGAQFALQAAPAGGGGSQFINQVVSANSVGLPIAGLLPDRRAAHLFEVPTLGACPGAAREGRGEAGARPCSQAGVLLGLGTVDLHGVQFALQAAPADPRPVHSLVPPLVIGASGLVLAGGYLAGAFATGDRPSGFGLGLAGGLVTGGLLGAGLGLTWTHSLENPGSLLGYILRPVLCGLGGAALGGLLGGVGAANPGTPRTVTHGIVVGVLLTETVFAAILLR